MSSSPFLSSGCQNVQAMVDQRPVYDGAVKKKRKNNGNQVISKGGIIRPDKRTKVRFL